MYFLFQNPRLLGHAWISNLLPSNGVYLSLVYVDLMSFCRFCNDAFNRWQVTSFTILTVSVMQSERKCTPTTEVKLLYCSSCLLSQLRI
jgi:hypothetical protein